LSEALKGQTNATPAKAAATIENQLLQRSCDCGNHTIGGLPQAKLNSKERGGRRLRIMTVAIGILASFIFDD